MDKKSTDKKDKQPSLMEIGFLSVFCGVMIGVFDSKLWFLVVLLIGAGIAAIVYYFLSRSEFDLLWRNLDMVKGNISPKLVEKAEEQKKICYRFRVPAGLGTEDFEKHKSAIVQYFGQEIHIKRDGKLVCIEVVQD